MAQTGRSKKVDFEAAALTCMLELYLKHAKGTNKSDVMPAWCSIANPEIEHEKCEKANLFEFNQLSEEVQQAIQEELEDEQRENEGEEEFSEEGEENNGGS